MFWTVSQLFLLCMWQGYQTTVFSHGRTRGNSLREIICRNAKCYPSVQNMWQIINCTITPNWKKKKSMEGMRCHRAKKKERKKRSRVNGWRAIITSEEKATFSLCCSAGKGKFPLIKDLPELLKHLLVEKHKSLGFHDNNKAYNSSLACALVGLPGKKYNFRNTGPYCH